MRWFYIFVVLFTVLFGTWLVLDKVNTDTLSFGENEELIQGSSVEWLGLNEQWQVQQWIQPERQLSQLHARLSVGHQFNFNSQHPAWQLINAFAQRFEKATAERPYAGIQLSKLSLQSHSIDIEMTATLGREQDMAELLAHVILQGPAHDDELLLTRFTPDFNLPQADVFDAQQWFNANVHNEALELVLSVAKSQPIETFKALQSIPAPIGQAKQSAQPLSGIVTAPHANAGLRLYFEQSVHPLTQQQLLLQLRSQHAHGLQASFGAEFKQPLLVSMQNDHLWLGLAGKELSAAQIDLIFAYFNLLKSSKNELAASQAKRVAMLDNDELPMANYLLQQAIYPVRADEQLAEVLNQLAPNRALWVQNSANTALTAFSTAQLTRWSAMGSNNLTLATDNLLAPKAAVAMQPIQAKSALYQHNPDYAIRSEQFNVWFKQSLASPRVFINVQLQADQLPNDAIANLQTQIAALSNSLFTSNSELRVEQNERQLIVQVAARPSIAMELQEMLLTSLIKGQSYAAAEVFIYGYFSAKQRIEWTTLWQKNLVLTADAPEIKTQTRYSNELKVLSGAHDSQLEWHFNEAQTIAEQALYYSLAQQIRLGLEDYFVLERKVAESVWVDQQNPQSLSIKIRSATTNPGLLELHLQKALGQITEQLKAYDSQEFATKNALSAYRLAQLYIPMQAENARLWRDIQQRFAHFNQQQQLATALQRLSKDQVVKFIAANMLNNDANRLTIHQVAAGTDYKASEFSDGRKILK